MKRQYRHQLRVLLGCECSGRVRDEFAARGWEAWSADLLPSETPVCSSVISANMLAEGQHSPLHNADPGHGPTGHYLGDVRELFGNGHQWDLFIGFPPCDHLSLAGARWWPQKRADGRQDAAADFFMEMIHAPAAFVAVENPRGDMTRRYRKPDQVVEPWMFGDPYSKKTCLWIRNADLPSYRIYGTSQALPLLAPSNPVTPVGRVTTGGGSHRTDKAAGRKAMNAYEDSEGRANRAKVRSRTFKGFAAAIAQQWGSFVEKQLLEGELSEAC